MPAASLRALLAHSIDYAGMFPPCSLGARLSAEKSRLNMSALRTNGCLVRSFSLPNNSMPRNNSFLNLMLNIHFALLRSDRRLRARMFFLKRLDDADAATRSLSRHNVDLHIDQSPGDVSAKGRRCRVAE